MHIVLVLGTQGELHFVIFDNTIFCLMQNGRFQSFLLCWQCKTLDGSLLFIYFLKVIVFVLIRKRKSSDSFKDFGQTSKGPPLVSLLLSFSLFGID